MSSQERLCEVKSIPALGCAADQKGKHLYIGELAGARPLEALPRLRQMGARRHRRQSLRGRVSIASSPVNCTLRKRISVPEKERLALEIAGL
jgi:hypothetical protein